MRLRFNRYTDDMLLSISRQSLASIALNALVRGVLFTLLIQLIAFASGQRVSSIVQILILVLVFAFVVFTIDFVEKSWVQYQLRKRP